MVPVLPEVVASASGASVSGPSVSVGSGDGESETVREGLGVGLPWTPPVAALAIVAATMSTAKAIRTILSGFMGWSRPDDPANAIGQTASSRVRTRRLSAEI